MQQLFDQELMHRQRAWEEEQEFGRREFQGTLIEEQHEWEGRQEDNRREWQERQEAERKKFDLILAGFLALVGIGSPAATVVVYWLTR